MPAPLRRPGEHAALEEALANARARLVHLATHDPVTDTLSREGLARALADLPPAGGLVLAVDCDDFARVNDDHGYAAGDRVLREVATRIRRALGPEAPLARVHGDRFLVLLLGAGEEEARTLAERIRVEVGGAPFPTEAGPVALTVSIGAARLTPTALSVDELLALARVALRRSKRRGKNRVCTSDDASTATFAVPRLRAFLAAVRFGEGLTVRAQRIVSLADGHDDGWEMLSRGPGDLENPVELFALAEQHQLTTPLDLTCLRTCVAAARRAGLSGAIHLNLLPTTLLSTEPRRLLAALGDPPPGARWCIELGERQFLGDPGELVDAAAALRAAGIEVAVDDVGSCRGTLDSVLLLEPDVAKLDIRLVRGVAGDPDRQRVVARLVRLSEALGCRLVAEGIETEADRDALLGLGVPLGQGWLWGRPEPI